MVLALKLESEQNEQTFESVNWSARRIVSVNFYDCVFKKVDLKQAGFIECTFSDCRFESSALDELQVSGSTFSNTIFEDSEVVSVNWTEAKWPKIKVPSPIHFYRCTINHSTFIGLSLREITIEACQAKDVDFREADLSFADLSHTDFEKSLFISTNLTNADFISAKNYEIDPKQNELRKAKFSLPEAMSLLYAMDIEIGDGSER